MGDEIHAAARSYLSVFPYIGAGAVELFTNIVAPPLEKRLQEWREEVGEGLRNLEATKGIRLEELQSNDVFIDTILHASPIALRNSQREKREALKNAVLNAALPNPPEQSLQQMFLNSIDTLTVWHLRLLKLFHDPQQWAIENNHEFPNMMSGGLSNILESAFPDLRGQRTLYDQIWRDLHQSGLVNTDSLHGTMSIQGLMSRRTSDLGAQFLSFVEEPR